MSTEKQARLVIIEGPDASGKTAVADCAAAMLDAPTGPISARAFHHTRNGGSPDLYVRALDYAHQRAALCRATDNSMDDVIVCDRWWHSTRVEASGAVVLRLDGLRVTNPNNSRRHWRVVAREARETKAAVLRALAAVTPPAGARWTVTMTREGRGVLDDDGLAAALKHARDAAARWIGVDDGPRGPVTWRYAQRRAKTYAVEVRVEVAK